MTTLNQESRRTAVLKTAGAPAVTLAEAQRQCSVEDDPSHDTYLESLLAAAEEYVAGVTSRALTASTWRLILDGFPCDLPWIELPKGNLRSVASVKYWIAGDSAVTTWDSANYETDTDSEPGRIVLANDISFPSDQLRIWNPVEIEFVAGWDESGAATAVKGQMPAVLTHAVLLLVAHWFRNREAVIPGSSGLSVSVKVALTVDSLVFPHKLRLL